MIVGSRLHILFASETPQLRNKSSVQLATPSTQTVLYANKSYLCWRLKAVAPMLYVELDPSYLETQEGDFPSCRCSPGYFGSPPNCTSCSPGRYRANTCTVPTCTEETMKDCLSCLKGKYASQSGLSACTDCAAGSFTNISNATNCQECSPGSYTGSVGASDCSLCVRGAFTSMYNSTECRPCAAGTFSTFTGAANCTPCQVGGYCPDAGAGSELVFQPCPAGTFSNQTGLNAANLYAHDTLVFVFVRLLMCILCFDVR